MSINFSPFFLSSGSGSLFCAYYPVPELSDAEFSATEVVIHLPAFVEEMNKSRRMVSLQAQALASAGTASLVIDLFGTGDSEGDFSEARWPLWKQNLQSAVGWLQDKGYKKISFSALRLGGLLALDVIDTSADEFEKLIWWQPVISGETHLMQFLRLRVAAAMFSNSDDEKETTKILRERLSAGEVIEVAGYDIHPELANALIEQTAKNFEKPALNQINLIELVANADKKLSPPVAKLADGWSQVGLNTSAETLKGDPFWSTQEISICPELIEWTTAKFK